MVENLFVGPEFGSFSINKFTWPCQHFQLTPNPWSECTKVCTLSIFASVLCTTSSAAWEWMAHLVCSSCKCKLEHVQTCLGAWACLTQCPSSMMLTFQELNYHSTYAIGWVTKHPTCSFTYTACSCKLIFLPSSSRIKFSFLIGFASSYDEMN
jgi:hypothetical protein